jgi:hypothetical protein
LPQQYVKSQLTIDVSIQASVDSIYLISQLDEPIPGPIAGACFQGVKLAAIKQLLLGHPLFQGQ